MAPTIIKQKKLFLKGEQDNEVNFSRLEATAVAEIPITVNFNLFQINFINLSNRN